MDLWTVVILFAKGVFFMIVPIYDHKPRKYKRTSKPINKFASAKLNRKHFILQGETVFIVSVQGNEVRLNKVDPQGNPISNVVYIDEKSKYII